MEFESPQPVENETLRSAEIDERALVGLLSSKSYKDRIAAYAAVSRFPQHIALVQNETMVPALDPALDALLAFEGKLTSAEVGGLLVHAAQSKPGLRSKISSLIDKVLETDEDGMVEALHGLTQHKNVRLVERVVSKLSEIVSSRKLGKENLEKVCTRLYDLMAAADKSVRQAASGLCVAVYRVIYDRIYAYIGNIRQIQLKELKSEFEKYAAPKVAVRIADLKCDDTSWKERLASMNVLKDSLLDPNSNELVAVLTRRLRDANMQVVHAAVEAVRNGKVSHPDVVRAMVMRFKDKKSTLSQLIKEAVATAGVESGVLLEILCGKAGDLKNPDIKIGVLDCLAAYSGLERAAEVAHLLDDGHAEVRAKAARVLSLGDVSALSECYQAKVVKLCKNGDCAASDTVRPSSLQSNSRVGAALPQSTGTSPGGSKNNSPMNGTSEPAASTRQDSLGHSSSACRSVDEFTAKYPLFQEKDWNKRLIYLKEAHSHIKREPIQVLINYFVQSKESNFNIVREILTLLSEHPQRHGAQERLCSYALVRLCEVKLRPEILALLRSLDDRVVVDSILANIQSSGSGKRFMAGLEVLGQLAPGRNARIDRFISETTATGVPEKTALEAFKSKYSGDIPVNGGIAGRARIGSRSSLGARYSLPGGGAKGGAALDPAPVLAPPTVSLVPAPTGPGIRVFKTDALVKDDKNLSGAFTDGFLGLMESDPYRAIHALSLYDQIAISGLLIRLYSVYYLPSSYFSALIHEFISQKYILLEPEAFMLVHHLLSNAMDVELDLLDRIYPATRLYKVYRSFVTNNEIAAQRDYCGEQISKLVYKCRRLQLDMSKEELADIITQSADFMRFVEALVSYRPRERQGHPPDRSIGKNATPAVANPFNRVKGPGDTPADAGHDKTAGKPVELLATTHSEDAAKKAFATFSVNIGEATPPAAKADEPNESSGLSDYEDSFIVGETVIEDVEGHDALNAPSILHDPTAAGPASNAEASGTQCSAMGEDVVKDVENSIANLSITNLSIATTPRKKKRNFNEIEDILNKLIHADTETSSDAFKRLNILIRDDVSSLTFLSNSLVGSSIIQLFDKFSDADFRKLALETLLKLSQNAEFCLSLRYETLKSAHADLARIVGEDTAAADVLINFCLNCGVEILRVYFDLLENNNELILKLIWRHSKRVDYTQSGVAAAVLGIVDSFYQRRGYILHVAENVMLKVCLLHVKDVCLNYSDGAKGFGVGVRTSAVIDLLLSGKSLDLDEVRMLFK